MRSNPAKKIEPQLGKVPTNPEKDAVPVIPKKITCQGVIMGVVCGKAGVPLSQLGLCKECQDREDKIAAQNKAINKMTLVGFFKSLFREKVFRFEKQLKEGIEELDKDQGYKRCKPKYQFRTALAQLEIELEKKRCQLEDIGITETQMLQLQAEVRAEEEK